MLRHLRYAIAAVICGLLVLAACGGTDSDEDADSGSETADITVEPASDQYRTHPSCVEALDLAEEAISERVPDVLSAVLFWMSDPYNPSVDAETARQVTEAGEWITANTPTYQAARDKCLSYVH